MSATPVSTSRTYTLNMAWGNRSASRRSPCCLVWWNGWGRSSRRGAGSCTARFADGYVRRAAASLHGWFPARSPRRPVQLGDRAPERTAADTHIVERGRYHPVAAAHEPEQDVLGTDGTVAQCDGFAEGELQDLLASPGEPGCAAVHRWT